MKKSSVLKIFFCILILLSANIYTFAGDKFVIVRSKNFRFVGEASEEAIRQEAIKLEQFREVLRRAFPDLNVDSPIEPTILVFKDSESFAPFKPVRENGLADRSVSGFFQSSDEANYIALSTGDDLKKSSDTIFHEYIHFVIKNNFQTSVLPVWLNEGLAEYFQTFYLKNERKAIFGEAQKNHLSLLRHYRLVPLRTLSAVDYESLARMDSGEKNLFYAQSWAVVHYLMRKNGGILNGRIKKYLSLIAEDKSPENAFKETFGATYAEVETNLENYVSKDFFKAEEFDLGDKLTFETRLETEPVSQAVWLNYLGDLLFQSQRFDESAEILRKSLASDEKSAAANLSLGKILMKQGNLSEAVARFEKSAALDDENYAANYYLADILFRENLADDGYVNEIPKEKAKKIRELLKKVIVQNPRLMEAYKMLASISLANGDENEESIALLQNALKIQPQNFRLEYNLAQLYLRRKNFEAARTIAFKLKENCAEKDFCERVKSFISVLDIIEQKEKELAELRKKYGLENVDFEAENLLPPEEAMNRALNRSLRKPLENEKRFAGKIIKIECGKTISFNIEGKNQNLKLSKPSFDGIMLISFSSNTAGMRIECGKPKTEMFIVATYKNNADEKLDFDGELFVLEFVPKEFKLIP